MVELRPEVIVAHSSPVVATLLGQTRNIPIVFVSISDPIGEGFVASFAHPGGNVTAEIDCPPPHRTVGPTRPDLAGVILGR